MNDTIECSEETPETFSIYLMGSAQVFINILNRIDVVDGSR